MFRFGLYVGIFAVLGISAVFAVRALPKANPDPGSVPTQTISVPTNPSVSFVIGGDMMFGRFVAHQFGQTHLTDAVAKLGPQAFQGADARIINLEGPVSNAPVPDDTEPNNLVFNFPPDTISALTYLTINVASQANNHSDNAGPSGAETTRQLLAQANIQPVGGPNPDDVARVAIVPGNGLTLVTIGVVAINSTTAPDITPIIAKYRSDTTNRILVFAHWGVEYRPVHSDHQAAMAHDWINAGADIVIGAHPHVVQDVEVYKGKPIVYSLGNLLFDQTFSAETQQGLLVHGTFTPNQLTLRGLPTIAKNLQPQLVTGAEADSRVNRIFAPFASVKDPNNNQWIFAK